MNYFLPFWSSPEYRQTTDRQLQTTDRKRCIRDHRATCTGGLKKGRGVDQKKKSVVPIHERPALSQPLSPDYKGTAFSVKKREVTLLSL